MYKIWIGTVLGLPHVEILNPHLGASKLAHDRWSDHAFDALSLPLFELAHTPEEADFLLIPHNYNLVKNKKEYLHVFEKAAESAGKKIIVIFPGDSNEEVLLSHAIVFRNSQYRASLRSNEIIMPAYTEDLGKSGIVTRKKGKLPVVGFCGWAHTSTLTQKIKLIVKNIFVSLPKKKGLWYREKILTLLPKDKQVQTNFIIRSSYSGNEKTISLPKDQARREYVANIVQSDYTLCVKGDGNFSIRFYEVLSLGRTPLYVDTDTVLPLEDVVSYDTFIVRVPHASWQHVGRIAHEAFEKMSDSDYELRQKQAREAFEKYLRADSFFYHVFSSGFLERYK